MKVILYALGFMAFYAAGYMTANYDDYLTARNELNREVVTIYKM